MNKKDLFETILFQGNSLKLCFNGSERNEKDTQPSWTGCNDLRGIYNGPEFDPTYDFENDPNNYAALMNTFVEQNELVEGASSCDTNYNSTSTSDKICDDATLDKSMMISLHEELCNLMNNGLGLEQRWFEYCKIQSINFIKQKFLHVAAIYGRTVDKDLFIYTLNATNRSQMENVFASCMRQVVVKNLARQRFGQY